MEVKIHFEELLQTLLDIYKKKNADYGNSVHQTLNEFGLVASVVRLSDKMNRLKTLSKQEAQVKSESIRDTLLDLANYCILTVDWIDSQKLQKHEQITSKNHLRKF